MKLRLSFQFQVPLFGFFMRRVLAAETAVLVELDPLRRLLLVLRRGVVTPLTFLASERDDVPHGSLGHF